MVTVDDLLLQGGDVALDFVNTVGGMRQDPPDPEFEALNSYANVVEWSLRVELVSPRDARALLREAAANPHEAERVLAETLEFRQLVYGIFRALADGRRPKRAALERLRDAEGDALAQGSLVADRARMRWSWEGAAHDLRAPLWPVTHAAVELLTHGSLERLKVCANCRWLFLDQSRNRSRRWCSMADCGSAVKKERYVERRRSRRAASAG